MKRQLIIGLVLVLLIGVCFGTYFGIDHYQTQKEKKAAEEAAALQLGGSIGGTLGKWMKFDEYDRKIMIMCGMSAAFSALFGTPLTATIFAMEVVSIGIMEYAALVPCAIASLIAREMADLVGARAEQFPVPASVAFDTLSSAKANNADVVIIDTAGRLHNKLNLMNELTKIKKVMEKIVPGAPHEILLVLDGSTGQNAFEQAKQFTAATEVNELAITKLDGTAKGGVVIGISDHFKIPVKYIGLGEGMEDLQVFRRKEFVDSLFGD